LRGRFEEVTTELLRWNLGLTGAKDLFAAGAARREHLFVAGSAEQLVVLEGERLVD